MLLERLLEATSGSRRQRELVEVQPEPRVSVTQGTLGQAERALEGLIINAVDERGVVRLSGVLTIEE